MRAKLDAALEEAIAFGNEVANKKATGDRQKIIDSKRATVLKLEPEEVAQWEETVIALLLVAMTLFVFVEVFNRFVLEGSIIWADELTLTMSAWLVLFGASWGVKQNAHIAVEAFVKALPRGPQRALGVLAAVLALVYCALLMVGAWEYLAKLAKIGIEMEDIAFPKWIAHSLLLWGMGLLALRVAMLLVNIVRGTETGFHGVDEAEETLRELRSQQEAGS